MMCCSTGGDDFDIEDPDVSWKAVMTSSVTLREVKLKMNAAMIWTILTSTLCLVAPQLTLAAPPASVQVNGSVRSLLLTRPVGGDCRAE